MDKGHHSKSETPNSISRDDIKKLCFVEYKSQTYAAFYNTKLERDKSILAFSLAAIGLNVTLLKLTEQISKYEISIFTLAFAAFFLAVVNVILVFNENSNYISSFVNDDDKNTSNAQADEFEKYLQEIDRNIEYSFYFGIIFTALLVWVKLS